MIYSTNTHATVICIYIQVQWKFLCFHLDKTSLKESSVLFLSLHHVWGEESSDPTLANFKRNTTPEDKALMWYVCLITNSLIFCYSSWAPETSNQPLWSCRDNRFNIYSLVLNNCLHHLFSYKVVIRYLQVGQKSKCPFMLSYVVI